MDTTINIRDIENNDLDAITTLYNYYILNTVISFEENPVSVEEFTQRVEKVKKQGHFWLIAENTEGVLGYAYSSQWNNRCAYQHSAESSIYISHQHLNQGIGTRLYKELFQRLKQSTTHTLISGIALPNSASVKLHESFGMKKVAHFQQTGFKFNKWIDVGYWQLLLAQNDQ